MRPKHGTMDHSSWGSNRFDHSALRRLLYLEWPLLGMALISEVVGQRFRHPHLNIEWSYPVSLLCLALFGSMRFWIPNRKSLRVFYTILEFGLLLFPCYVSHWRSPFFVFPSLVVVLRSCILFEGIGRWITSGLILANYIALQLVRPAPRGLFGSLVGPPPPRSGVLRSMSPESLQAAFLELRVISILLYSLLLIFVLLAGMALLAESQRRRELSIAHEKLKQYALQIESQAALHERNRIAREIHDSLGHALTAQSIQLQNALVYLQTNVEKTQTFLEEAFRLGSTALQNIRQSVATLRADPWRHRSLNVEIITLLKEFHQSTGILPESELEWSSPLPEAMCVTIYRILQESLTNIAKHSQADQVHIVLREYPDHLLLQIQDNGKGFDPSRNTTGFGIQGMRERTQSVQGQFALISQPGQGCQLTIQIPLGEP